MLALIREIVDLKFVYNKHKRTAVLHKTLFADRCAKVFLGEETFPKHLRPAERELKALEKLLKLNGWSGARLEFLLRE